MDITNNKYIRYIFDDLGKVSGCRYSSLLYRKVVQDRTLSQQDKVRIETAIALLRMNGYVEKKEGNTPVMSLVLATEDKGNKVIEFGKRVVIEADLLGWLPYEKDRKNYGKMLYELTGDNDSFFPATDDSVKQAIAETGINIPPNIIDRIDIYDFVMQHVEKSVYDKFLKTLSELIENQEKDKANVTTVASTRQPLVTNANISNPVVIGNMIDNNIKTTDKSNVTNVAVNGNNNQVVTGNKNIRIDNANSAKASPHWLQILYWILGIMVAFITIYSFFIK